jgi:hypothetical protein
MTIQRTRRQMELYIIVDTKGSGRILGAFDSRERADRIVNHYPAYYKLHTCRLNKINAEVLDWADDDEQREALRRLLAEEG